MKGVLSVLDNVSIDHGKLCKYGLDLSGKGSILPLKQTNKTFFKSFFFFCFMKKLILYNCSVWMALSWIQHIIEAKLYDFYFIWQLQTASVSRGFFFSLPYQQVHIGVKLFSKAQIHLRLPAIFIHSFIHTYLHFMYVP